MAQKVKGLSRHKSHTFYLWPLNVEPTYNLKATYSTKESLLR